MNALRCPMDEEAADTTDDDVAIAAMAIVVATLHLILVIVNINEDLGMKSMIYRFTTARKVARTSQKQRGKENCLPLRR
jgi:hypothetical protein